MSIRSEQEKQDMLSDLEKEKETAPEFTMFGDSNWEGIDAQKTAIEEEWDEDDVYDNYPDDEDDAFIRDMALDAVYWLKGSHDSSVLLGQWG